MVGWEEKIENKAKRPARLGAGAELGNITLHLVNRSINL